MGKRLDLIATRTSGASARQEIILSIKRGGPKADRLPERHDGRFFFAVIGEFTTTRLELSGAATSSAVSRSRSKGCR